VNACILDLSCSIITQHSFWPKWMVVCQQPVQLPCSAIS
jgi:hypothetical protein